MTFKNRAIEFFHNDNGTQLSMSRLLMLGSFVVTSIIMIKLTATAEMNEGFFSMYIGAWSGSYLIGKGIDASASKRKGK